MYNDQIVLILSNFSDQLHFLIILLKFINGDISAVALLRILENEKLLQFSRRELRIQKSVQVKIY